MRSRVVLTLFAAGIAATAIVRGQRAVDDQHITNSVGMALVRIAPGSFLMGESNPIPDALKLKDLEYLPNGDWDETPVRRVTISQPFHIGVTEVTLEQYRQFDPDYVPPAPGTLENGQDAPATPFVTGINWHEATAFCEWLSKKEGKSYRLPTEAEWEYATRAGTTTTFWSGAQPPSDDAPNAWGVRNVHGGVAEWVRDWYAAYPAQDETDPVGPASGWARVIRGGGLDLLAPYYARSANRASYGPDFPPPAQRVATAALKATAGVGAPSSTSASTDGARPKLYAAFTRDRLNHQGQHAIGFRVVLASSPRTTPRVVELPFFQQAVKQDATLASRGPSSRTPYFRKRHLLPIPPENTPIAELGHHRIAGLHPAMLRHQHSPALTVAPNGDVIAIYYTSSSETRPDIALIATRLRFGADAWDMPSFFLDFADANDHAPMLTTDNGTLRFYWGSNQLDSGFPFQTIASTDSGATWSVPQFPVFTSWLGGHSAQPITNAFRGPDNTMYVGSDAVNAESVLWASSDEGRTWVDPGGRTNGRHTAFAVLKDGRLLGMGGKNSNIDGFMPRSISRDGGRTWQYSKTPFPALASNQRPTLVRLASGRLFFAGDLQDNAGARPAGVTLPRGAYVALSDDEGETWTIKRLVGAEAHETPARAARLGGPTLGYAVAAQSQNGLIHLITSMNRQALHFALNEAWILAPADGVTDADVATQPALPAVGRTETHDERFADGRSARATWSSAELADGTYVLHGEETWTYRNGGTQWSATYDRGRKVGLERYRSEDGTVQWTLDHRRDGTSVWTQFWPNGTKRSESTWRDMQAIGVATTWDATGRQTGRAQF
ncbi:MAG: SUMF1/EgtB/PvdO family nonheme iron enzyme [Acidobacteria bacterium]|nr:SUMF1/EgtB/PvdO family nonheme iron enzyme [Acidobacteriota bacterium]